MFQSKHILHEIIDREPLMGSFLFDRGIVYMNYPELSLNDVCNLHRIDSDKLITEMSHWQSVNDSPSIEDLDKIPVDLLIAYLQGVHQRFLWRRLPYMQDLVDSLDPNDLDRPSVIRDLKLIFPMFVSEFILHIHEEEDLLFSRVLEMYKVLKTGGNPGKLYLFEAKNCLHQMALAHHEEDDDMEGIRELTENYYLPEKAGLNVKVIFAELQHFEKELRKHADIENEILFPKAISLQKKLEKQIQKTHSLN